MVKTPNNTIKRLEELSLLKDGWYDGHGFAPSSLSIDKAKLITDELSKLNVKLYIYPLADGGISIEFSSVYLNFDIEICNNKDRASLFCFSIHSYYEIEYDFNKLQTVFNMNDKQLQEFIDAHF